MSRERYAYRLLSLAAIVSLLLPAATAPPVYATVDVTPRMGGVIPGGERRITTDPSDQMDPSISGGIIVYTDFRGADADIWYYDLAASSEQAATTALGDQYLTDVSDGSIAYDDYAVGGVWVYHVASGATTHIAGSYTVPAFNPAIGGTLVAWEDLRNSASSSYDIYANDLSSGIERLVAGSPDGEIRPAVASSVIVYQSHTGPYETPGDIHAYDWATGSTRAIEENPNIDGRNPDTNGQAVVYDGRDTSTDTKDIYLFDLATGEEKRLVLPGDQENPNISGDYVSFEERPDDPYDKYHVRLWHMPTGTVFDLNVPTTSSQFLNDIDGSRVVYTDDRGGQFDVYMYAFETPTYTITVTTDPGGTITPSGEVTVNIGETQGFTITPDAGYYILDVVVDDVSQGAIDSYTFTSVADDHTIAASFACGDVETAPTSIQFGDVAVGASATQIVTLSNIGAAKLTVTGISIAPSSSGFAVTSAPSTPFTLAPRATVDLAIAFTPTVAGPASGALRITSDDPDEGLVEVELSGNGVSGETPPSEQLAIILTFFDDSVADGTIVGSGPGNSAKGRLGALRNMIEAAGDLIDEGRIDEAIQQLQAAYLHVDSLPRPPDFVTGPAAAELASMIQQLIESLGGQV